MDALGQNMPPGEFENLIALGRDTSNLGAWRDVIEAADTADTADTAGVSPAKVKAIIEAIK